MPRRRAASRSRTRRSGNGARRRANSSASPNADGTVEVRREALRRAADLYRRASERVGDSQLHKFVERYPGAARPADRGAAEARRHGGRNDTTSGERDRWLQDIVMPTPAPAASAPSAASISPRRRRSSRGTGGRRVRGRQLSAPLKKNLALKKERMKRRSQGLRQGRRIRRRRSDDGGNLRDGGAVSHARQGPDGVGAPEEPAKRTSSSNTTSFSRNRRFRSRRRRSRSTRRMSRAPRKASTTNGCGRVSMRWRKLKPARYAKAEISAEFVKELR